VADRLQARYPDFYLVGAPKCGTTAFYDFLAQHPDIFVPEKKELLIFGTDLSYPSRLSEDAFLAHFAARDRERLAGTAHTAYLQSHRAAREIHAKRPDAKILVMVRNPVEVVHSWHSELLYETIEDIESFELALAAEPERRRGKRIPRNARNSYVESLFYTDVVSFGAQVQRYVDVFGRSQVHVIVHDDLRADPQGVYRSAVGFLGADPGFVPDFAVRNANKIVRNRLLQRLYFGTATPGHAVVRRLIPSRARRRLLAMNVREAPRAELEPALRSHLEEAFRPDVDELGRILGRDLSSWTRSQ
jgi:sulfotransferase family protein